MLKYQDRVSKIILNLEMALEYDMGVMLHIWDETANCFGDSKMRI